MILHRKLFYGISMLLLPVLLAMTILVADRFTTTGGNIYFKSEAPLELIEAQSGQLKGVIDTKENTFAFTVPNNSFKGFNSALQQEHFNENYMESVKYPTSTFSGKIIEQIDFSADGIYTIRAKGKLQVHGVEKERIIPATLEVKKGKIMVTSNFTVQLADHNITIPKIVYQKIAEEIYVEVKSEFTKK